MLQTFVLLVVFSIILTAIISPAVIALFRRRVSLSMNQAAGAASDHVAWSPKEPAESATPSALSDRADALIALDANRRTITDGKTE